MDEETLTELYLTSLNGGAPVSDALKERAEIENWAAAVMKPDGATGKAERADDAPAGSSPARGSQTDP